MIKLLPGYVLIEPIKGEDTTASGLITPDSSKDRPVKGMVVGVSPIIPIQEHFVITEKDHTWVSECSKVKVGSIVFYRKWGGDEIKDQGKEYRIVKFQDVMAIYE
jgi:chaperonin GroES